MTNWLDVSSDCVGLSLPQPQTDRTGVAPERVNRGVSHEVIGKFTRVGSFTSFVENVEFPSVFIFLSRQSTRFVMGE